MISQLLKDKAFELRKFGKSYGYISKETGISGGMLSYWFSKIEWSKKIAKHNNDENLKNFKGKVLLMNIQRQLKLSEEYRLVEEESVKQFENFKNDPLFVGSLMLYLGEGDKSTKTGSVRIANTDYSVLKVFIRFLQKYCNISTDIVHFWLLAYPDLNVKNCENWWLEKLKLTYKNIYKTQVIQGRYKTKRLRFGVGNIIIPRKALKIRILKWIELMSEELMRA